MSFQTVTMTLLDGFLLNIELFAVTLVLSLPLGLVVSFGTMSRFKPLSLLVRLYVYIMRSTPLMLQLAVVFYLPGIVFGPGHSLGRMGAAVLAFVLNYAAYFSEIFRGGIQGVPAGQREAGQVLGMTRRRAGRPCAPASQPRRVSQVRPAAMDTTACPSPRAGTSSESTPSIIWGLTHRKTYSAWAAAARLSSATAHPSSAARASALARVRLATTTCSAPTARHAA